MVMAGPWVIPTVNTPMDDGLLLLAQWLSPGFPLGSFAYSQGLESAIADGVVGDAETLELWLADTLEHGTGRTDAILIRSAHGATDRNVLSQIDATARAFASCAGRSIELHDMGAAFSNTVDAVWAVGLDGLSFPVGFGAACRARGIDVDRAVPFYLHAGVANVVAAAQRLMPLGQTRAQGVIAALSPLCERVAAETRGATPDDIATASFAADIAAMRHETLEPRIFRT